MNFQPLGMLKSLGHDLVAAPKRLAHMVTHPSEAVHELPGLAKDVFMSPLNPLSWPVRGLKAGLDQLPDQVTIAPKMPAYTKLAPEAIAEAVSRSKGLSYPMPCIQGNTGSMNEPVSVVVSGTREQLVSALEKAGWTQAEKGSILSTIHKDFSQLVKAAHLPAIGLDYNPQNTEVSKAFLRGKPQDMSFNKNDDHHLVRDHIRIYDTGRQDAQGRPVWEIAATRDTATSLRLPSLMEGHHIDLAIDKERDMLMADLLTTGLVKDWKVAQGVQTPEEKANTDAKFTGNNQGKIDGRVYVVNL